MKAEASLIVRSKQVDEKKGPAFSQGWLFLDRAARLGSEPDQSDRCSRIGGYERTGSGGISPAKSAAWATASPGAQSLFSSSSPSIRRVRRPEAQSRRVSHHRRKTAHVLYARPVDRAVVGAYNAPQIVLQ